jgi:SAM-dependent methyltransferase
MLIFRLRSYDEYQHHSQMMHEEYASRERYEKNLVPKWRKSFKVSGYSYPVGREVRFHVDFKYSRNNGLPNWRERLVCPISRLNNRMRASVHIFDIECSPYSQDRIYISEQVTPLYKYFSSRFENITGSEFLGEGITPGSLNTSGVRHEDLTNLSFINGSFKHFLSFDCFEHIPNYQKTFSESSRILATGGTMLFTVPFALHSQLNITRARVSADGSINHIMETEYHGDPMNKEGCLCYQYFGWEMLNELKNVGFRDAFAVLCWSKDYGYLGGEQLLFVAKK